MCTKEALIGLILGLSLVGTITAGYADDVAHGRKIYRQYCASCHGLSGEGDGYMARALTIPPANLRLLSERYGNPLPRDLIARFIDGRADVKAHGPRDMPVWGERFYAETGGSKSMAKRVIASLVAYVQSIQLPSRAARLNTSQRDQRAGGDFYD